jgi:hypothetical protein
MSLKNFPRMQNRKKRETGVKNDNNVGQDSELSVNNNKRNGQTALKAIKRGDKNVQENVDIKLKRSNRIQAMKPLRG